jgi:hypothetical protein
MARGRSQAGAGGRQEADRLRARAHMGDRCSPSLLFFLLLSDRIYKSSYEPIYWIAMTPIERFHPTACWFLGQLYQSIRADFFVNRIIEEIGPLQQENNRICDSQLDCRRRQPKPE